MICRRLKKRVHFRFVLHTGADFRPGHELGHPRVRAARDLHRAGFRRFREPLLPSDRGEYFFEYFIRGLVFLYSV